MIKNILYLPLVLMVVALTAFSAQTIPGFQLIPGGTYDMGDHSGLGGNDPNHPSDEIPIHAVTLDSFYMGTYHVTNDQFCEFLNGAYKSGMIEITSGVVYPKGKTDTLFKTYQASTYSSIQFAGDSFSVRDFRRNHPVTDIRWNGAVVYCNWLSGVQSLQPCFNLTTWKCDFTKNGYRLPTEAEWEYAAYGGKNNPYPIFPWGDDKNTSGTYANWEQSGDPYETGPMPFTTPVGFYNGALQKKTDFQWPGTQETYQTASNKNGYGLYDMSGNAWQVVYDWYSNPYYKTSPKVNPPGPDTGQAMPDGKPYHVMRGGNWFNGKDLWGHGRASNRNPMYYRGPQDPIHPWYHVSFRVVKNTAVPTAIFNGQHDQSGARGFQIKFCAGGTDHVSFTLQTASGGPMTMRISDLAGRSICVVAKGHTPAGQAFIIWNGRNQSGHPVAGGFYLCKITVGGISDAVVFCFDN